MTLDATTSRSARPTAAASGAGQIRRWLWLAALALALAAAAVAVIVIPGWIPLLPRQIVRTFVEGLLRSILIVYGVALLASLAGAPLLGLLLARAGHGKPALLADTPLLAWAANKGR